MNTLETDVEVAADGSIRLLSPMPEWLKPGRTHLLLVATEGSGSKPTKQVPTATPEMIEQRLAAFEKLRQMNPYRDLANPVEWQREIRHDVVIPGRE